MTSLLPTPATSAIPLEPWRYQDMRWCANCEGMQAVISVFEIEAGRLGLCMGCGEEKFMPFTRVTEAA